MDERKTSPVRMLPDPAICRVRQIGTISGFAHCLVNQPVECRYVLYFGQGNICRYAGWKEFLVKETEPGEQ